MNRSDDGLLLDSLVGRRSKENKARPQFKMKSIYAFFLLPLLAILAHYFLFSGIVRPPTDHGKGSMFDLIAGRYDMINRILALGMDLSWRRRMVSEIKSSLNQEQLGYKILDVSTGTADVALLLASEIRGAAVLGVDPSEKMLDIGRGKVKEQDLESMVDLQMFDARDMKRLPESSFDAATMAFGIRNVPERDVALCEIHRLLKPSSRFCILEFSEPDDSFGVMGVAARFFIRNVIPFLGGILSGAPREYWHLQNSIKNFPSPLDFAKEIENSDCPNGSFEVEHIYQLNFGSVQIYVSKATKPERQDYDQLQEDKSSGESA